MGRRLNQAETLLGQALNHHQAGRLGEAEAFYRAVLRVSPGHAMALCYLGVAMGQTGHTQAALAHLSDALRVAPDFLDAHVNLGKALEAAGRPEDAATSYRRALALEPEIPEVHFNLGKVLQDLGRLEEAEAAYRHVLRLSPGHEQALLNLGMALRDQGRLEAAMAAYLQLLARRPDSHEAHNNLGNVLRDLGRLDEAVACYHRALALRPGFHEAHNNLGMAEKDQGRLEEAIASFRRALESRPDDLNAFSNLLFVQNYLAEQSPEALLGQARSFGALVAAKARAHRDWRCTPLPGRRLRVGLVSGDLRKHAVASFLEGILVALDDAQIELHAYATHPREDDMTRRLKGRFARWTQAAGLSDEALARRVYDDAIDILIDLAGHTADNRLSVFAWKPAPVQCTWLGYLGTTGVAEVDYLLADPYAVPVGEEAQFTESIWRLPESYLCFTTTGIELDVGELPALANGYMTFASFNNLAKVNEAVLACWSAVLKAVPDSRLLLKSRQLADVAVRQGILERFAAQGIAVGRLELAHWAPGREAHLATYRRVDVALDPFPYPGITTTMESLWMGVPTLTLRGDRFIAHQGETIMHNAGLADWIALDPEDYVAKAVRFATDPPALSALRRELRRQVQASPLCDAPRFARHFEAAMRGMWTHWCARQAGASQQEMKNA